MIRIHNCIFNENKILKIEENDQENKLIVYYDTNNHDRVLRYIENTTLEDIEWNYEDEQIRKCLESNYKEEELEEEKNRIKSDYTSVKISCNVLENRINKAIKYIETTKYEWGDLEEDNEDYDIDVYKLLEILKGEE